MTDRPRRAGAVRRALVVAAIVTATIAVFGVAGLPFYVLPATDDPRGVDAVMVLGPPESERLVVAERISTENGGVPIVVSAPASGPLAIADLPICREDGVLCRTPAPFTTLGEALLVRDLAAENEWRSVAVVTMTPHISRARLIFERCDVGDVRMVSSGAPDSAAWWAFQYAYQTAAFAKALITPC